MPEREAGSGSGNREQIGRAHLAKALIKALPLVGDTINEMVFETAKDEASANDKKKLYTTLTEIQSRQNAASTDLGDVLNRLEQQHYEMQAVRQAITDFLAYLNGKADTATTARIEKAAERALPGYEASTAHSEAIGELDRFALSKAMENGLEPSQLEAVIGDIPGARKKVPANADMEQQITRLLNWAESVDGPGLAKVYTYIKRRYERFALYP